MPNLTTVGLTAGAATSGTGTVSTLDNVVGVAGTPSAQVQTVQGITSMTALKVDGSAVTQPVSATLAAETTKVIGVTRTADGAGNLLTSTANALDINVKSGGNVNGRATPANSAPVVEASRIYQDVAASATATVLVGAGAGAAGDWLEGILVIPETTSAGTVALLDNATSVNVFVTGTLPSLVPFYVPMGCASKNGAWKITTGAAVHVRAFGNFT